MHQPQSEDGPFGPFVNGTMIVVFYQYRPNREAGYAFMVLFAIATLAHLVYLIRLKAWIFIPFLMGGLAELFGYYGRALSHDRPDKVGPWIQQNLLILVGAPLLTATIYMALGRIITALQAGQYSLIKPRWMTRLYVLIDVACLASQLAGAVMPASGDANLIELSRKIILGGLILQLVALSIFCYITWHVSRSISRREAKEFCKDAGVNWKNHFRTVLLTASFVLVRSLVRVIEYAQGDQGFIVSHEVFVYLFDAALMWLVMVAFLIIHPSRLLRDAYLLIDQGVLMRRQGFE
ncbi:hypothetical protein J3459_013633 [Metarhizium acridum]|nr:hypothetical protein J3459_013633 [Metarhizium acridum]